MTPNEAKERQARFIKVLFTAIQEAGEDGLPRSDIVKRSIEGYAVGIVDAKLSNFVLKDKTLKRAGHNYLLTKKGEAVLANGHDTLAQGEQGAATEGGEAATTTTASPPSAKRKKGSTAGFSQREREARASELRAMVLATLGNTQLRRKDLWHAVHPKLPHVTLSAFNNLMDRGTKSGLLKQDGRTKLYSKGDVKKTGTALVAGITNIQRGQQMREVIRGIMGESDRTLQAGQILERLHHDGHKITSSNLSAYLKNMATERQIVKTPTGWAVLNSDTQPEVLSSIEITFNIRVGNQRLDKVTQRDAFQLVNELSGILRFGGH